MENMSKLIAKFLAHFENRKHNLAFNIQDGTGYIYLVADGLQLSEVAKLLLLKGKEKTFEVKIYENTGDSNSAQNQGCENL